MAWSAARNAASGPFWFTAPRPTSTFPSPCFSTSAPSQGGEDHSAGSACFTSYMKYRPRVRGAPASTVAKMPGWPSVDTFVTSLNPASRKSLIVRSQPWVMPLFSAAIDGCRTHSCKRCTASSWRLSISVRMAPRSLASAHAQHGHASATVLATAPWRKARRSIGGEHNFEPNPFPRVACSDAVRLDSNEFDIVPSVETRCVRDFHLGSAVPRSIHNVDLTLRLISPPFQHKRFAMRFLHSSEEHEQHGAVCGRSKAEGHEASL